MVNCSRAEHAPVKSAHGARLRPHLSPSFGESLSPQTPICARRGSQPTRHGPIKPIEIAEPAHRLGLSHSTMIHHLANARTKVGATTTCHRLARAWSSSTTASDSDCPSRWRPERGEHALAHARSDGSKGLHQVRQEPGRFGIALVQREPRDRQPHSATHSATRVLLPKPAGAETSVSLRWSPSLSRSSRRGRRTILDRRGGT